MASSGSSSNPDSIAFNTCRSALFQIFFKPRTLNAARAPEKLRGVATR